MRRARRRQAGDPGRTGSWRSIGPDKAHGRRRRPCSRIRRDTSHWCSRASTVPRRPDRSTIRSRKDRCGGRQWRRDKARPDRPAHRQSTRGPRMRRWASRAGCGSEVHQCSLHQTCSRAGKVGFPTGRRDRNSWLRSPGLRKHFRPGSHSSGTRRCTCHRAVRWCMGWRPSRSNGDSLRTAGRPGRAHPSRWPTR